MFRMLLELSRGNRPSPFVVPAIEPKPAQPIATEWFALMVGNREIVGVARLWRIADIPPGPPEEVRLAGPEGFVWVLGAP